MKVIGKLLFGNKKTLLFVALSIGVSVLVLKSPFASLAGYILPVLLLTSALWLAKD